MREKVFFPTGKAGCPEGGGEPEGRQTPECMAGEGRGCCVLARGLPFVIFQPFWVFGKPSFLHALALVEYFQDAPKGGKGHYAEDDAQVEVREVERHAAANDAHDEESPPAFRAEIILAFDDQRVEQPDDEERCQSDKNARVVHCCRGLLRMCLQR